MKYVINNFYFEHDFINNLIIAAKFQIYNISIIIIFWVSKKTILCI